MSACMSGTRGSGVLSSTGDVLVRGVGGVCDMCMCLARGGVGVEGGEWMSSRSSSLLCRQAIFSHSSSHCFPTSLNIIRSSNEQGCARWEHCNYMSCFFCSSTNTCGVSCVELPLLPLCIAASIPCGQMVDTSPRGPWTVITIRHLFVKFNYVHVRFIAASNNFRWNVTFTGINMLTSGVW